ncbi:MAG: class II aldolase/adducin family protein [Ilumatobacteraceae bacterium]
MEITDRRFRVAMARRMLFRNGCDTGIAQHVSERCDGEEAFWVTALEHGDMTTPRSIAKFDFAKRMLESGEVLDPPLEYAPDYIEVYEDRPDVMAVVHTHSFWTMVLCTLGETIGMFNTTASLLADQQSAWADDLFDPRPRGRRIAEALGDRSILLMRNHGLVVAAGSLEAATVLACVVEEQARLHLEATARGGTEMPPEHIRSTFKAHDRTYVRHTWAANVRRLRVTDPDLFEHLGGSSTADPGEVATAQ